MNGLAILLAAASVGVDYGWRPTDDGQLEYIVQIEPTLLDALAGGQEIVSEIHPDVRSVRRFRIQVGTGPLPREGAPVPFATKTDSATAPAGPPPPEWDKTDTPGESADRAFRPPPGPERHPAASLGAPVAAPPLLPNPPTTEKGSDGNRTASPQPLWLDRPVQPPVKGLEAPPDLSQPFVSAARKNFPQRGAASDAKSADTRRSTPQPRTPADPPAASPSKGSASATEPNGRESANAGASPSPAAGRDPGNPSQQTGASDSDKPWLPLTLTSLALFASLGANLYLAWIAWGFYMRHQKLAAQIQAAGSSAA